MVKFKKDKRGKYYFTASLGFDEVTGKRIQKMRSGFSTIKEAREAYAEIISNFGKEAYSSNSTMLYEEFFYTIFLPYYKGRVKERTYNNRLSTIKNTFAYFFKMKLKSIAPVHIQKWQNELLEQYENTYVRNIYGLFQMSLDRAVVLGMISSNPAKIVGNVKKSKKEIDFWTKEEFEKAIQSYDNSIYNRYTLDSIRLAFEFFMQDILKNSKSLENQPIEGELLPLLRKKGIPKEIINLVRLIIKGLISYQNENVKHSQTFTDLEVEFVIEQTSILMKLFAKIEKIENES